MASESAIEQALEVALRRDRSVVLAALAAVILASWAYVLAGAGMDMSALEMTQMTEIQRQAAPGTSGEAAPGDAAPGTTAAPGGMAVMAVMAPAAWDGGYAALMLIMWWIMMVAMMLPSAGPMILLFAAVSRKRRERGTPFVPTGIFAAGYVVAWGAFSVIVTGLQWGLERSGLMSAMMVGTSLALGAGLLIAAGIWQLTPLKHACLRHCRSPLHFLAHRWRDGRIGALRMGVEHGAFCLGCCWFLMGLLFYGGVMNLYWIVGLAAFVLIEKTIPVGHWLGAAAGVALISWGSWLLAAAL